MKRLLTGIVLTFVVTLGLSVPPHQVHAADSTSTAKSAVCDGVSGQTGGDCAAGGGVDLSKTVKAILTILSVVAGVAAVIMIIIAGMRYITSGGDAQAVSGAKQALIYAVIGLVVVTFSQILVHFVLASAQGTTTSQVAPKNPPCKVGKACPQ